MEDVAGFREGEHLDIVLRDKMLGNGKDFAPRAYQRAAAERWWQDGRPAGGCGVVVLACGAGKTIVAMTAMSLVQTKTLILATNQAAVTQWRRELIDKTGPSDQVGMYTGENKIIAPVTIATYQILTWRRSKTADFEHLHLFEDQDWGLIVYDEVHLLPAPVFGATATLQGRRRLGLTATLVREDGREGDVFALVGPKRYDLPWQLLQDQGFIAETSCHEVRVPFQPRLLDKYDRAREAEKFRIASTNPEKMKVLADLLKKHEEDNILDRHARRPVASDRAQVPRPPDHRKDAALRTRRPLRQVPHRQINPLVEQGRNFSIDLPDANIAIQVSGPGSRQEEAQRLGRILRPKKKAAVFYTVVTGDTKEQEPALKRQLFLTEQGYRYHIDDRASG